METGTQGQQAAADKVNIQPPPAFLNKHCVETVNCGLYGAERLLRNNKGRKFRMEKGQLINIIKEKKKISTYRSLDGIELSFITGALATCIAFTSFFMYNILERLLIVN